MTITEALTRELEYEGANTRKILERVPADKLGWKPHEKSMALGRLAGHIAELPNWAVMTVNQEELDLMPNGKMEYKPFEPQSTADILQLFDKNLQAAKQALASTSDQELGKIWKLKANQKVLLEMPKAAVIRNMVYNHTIHHRGQLSVFLRLLEVPIPGLYGPSADEQGMF